MENDRHDYLDCCDDCSYQEYLIHQEDLRMQAEDLEEILLDSEDEELREALRKRIGRINDELLEPYSRYDWDREYRRLNSNRMDAFSSGVL